MINIGQRTKRTFALVDSGSVGLFAECENNIYDCGFVMPVFANDSGENLENDKSSILAMFQAWTTEVTFIIQKLQAGVYVDKDEFDSTYGELFPLGFSTKFPKYAGIVIDWAAVLDEWGEGQYRIKIEEENTLGTVDHYSKPYCLQTYNCELVNNTVRLEWNNNRGIGDIDNDRKIVNYGDLNWFSQMRLPNAIFGYPVSTYEREEIQYNNGQFEDYKNVQEETYQLTLGSLPAWVHDIVKTYACMSGSLRITDYSQNNPQKIIDKAVKLTSGYEPRWNKQNKCAPVTLEFKPTFNRLETFRCT